MAKINVYGLTRPPRKSASKEFDTGAGVLKLVFRRMTTVDFSRAYERAEELITRYVTGDEDEGIAPVPFFPVGEDFSDVTDSLCRTAAQFEVSQPEDLTDKYTAEEFLAMANGLPPETWLEIRRFFNDLNKGQSQGNASGAVTATSSELPTGKTESDTQS